jgi:CRP-like cAMP-binding protein
MNLALKNPSSYCVCQFQSEDRFMKYSREKIAETVAQSDWFQDLPPEALEQLCAKAFVKTFNADQFLYLIGETCQSVYCIMSGRVRLSITSSIGQEFVLTDLHEGAWLGETSLIDGETRVSEAWALDSCEILTIPANTVKQVGENYPGMYKNLFFEHMRRTQRLYELMAGMLFYPLKSRLAGRLLNLAKKHGEVSADGVELDIHMSQLDFARMSMGSRQRVNKIFRDWVREGILLKQGDKYVIKDVIALRKETELEDPA